MRNMALKIKNFQEKPNADEHAIHPISSHSDRRRPNPNYSDLSQPRIFPNGNRSTCLPKQREI